jgi:hypothetical protein
MHASMSAALLAAALLGLCQAAEAKEAVRSGEQAYSRSSEAQPSEALQQQVARYRYYQTVQQTMRTDWPISSLPIRSVR